MKSCWKFEPEQRPNFSEFVKQIKYLKDTSQNTPMVKRSSTSYLPLYS